MCRPFFEQKYTFQYTEHRSAQFLSPHTNIFNLTPAARTRGIHMAEPLEKRIARIWDFDLTLTEEYQQLPLIRKYLDNIKKKHPSLVDPLDPAAGYLSLFGEYRKRRFSEGINYLTPMLEDIQDGVFPNLSNKELKSLGKDIKLAPGLPDFFERDQAYWRGQGVEVRDFVVSVGIVPLIAGSSIAKHLGAQGHHGIYACEFDENNGVICGIKTVLPPFEKTRAIIEIAKGNPEKLNEPMSHTQYFVDYPNILCIGDGFSDFPLFGFARKKGCTNVCVYRDQDWHEFKEAKKVVGWTEWLIPRDYREGSRSERALHRAMRGILNRKCKMDPEVLYRYREGAFDSFPEMKEQFQRHIDTCDSCEDSHILHAIPPR